MMDTNNGQLEMFRPGRIDATRQVNMRVNGAAYTPRMAVNPQGLIYVVNSHNLPNFNSSIG